MKYASVSTGVEAPGLAWIPLGYEPVWFSEISPAACRFLGAQYPEVPNLGDMTKLEHNEIYRQSTFNLLVGGTPCQPFSIAGLRKGLDSANGNLSLVFCRILLQKQPGWFVWENVPGVFSSNGGRDFRAILNGFRECGYSFAYRVLDSQHFGVPQRRRRVIVVGHLGDDWRPPAAVLFESESLRRDFTPHRKEGQRVAGTLESRTSGGGWPGTDGALNGHVITVRAANTSSNGIGVNEDGLAYTLDTSGPCHIVMATGQANAELVHGQAPCLTVNHEAPILFSSQPMPFDTTQITSPQNRSNPKPGDPCHPLTDQRHPPAIAFMAGQGSEAGGLGASSEVSPTLRVAASGLNQVPSVLLPVPINTQVATRHNRLGEGTGLGIGSPGDPAFTLQAAHHHAFFANNVVRRLTPLECERLQGFPDGYTNVAGLSDSARYKLIGNSMTRQVMEWVGRRILMVQDIIESLK